MNNLKRGFVFALIAIGLMAFNPIKKLPEGWKKHGSNPKMYKMGLDNKIFMEGANSGFIKSKKEKTYGFGSLMQTCSAKEFSGKKIRMTGYLKSKNVNGWTGLWLRINGDDKLNPLAFDNMHDRQIKGTMDWTKCEIEMLVPENSVTFSFGALLVGSGKIWFDNISFEEIPSSDSLKTTSIKLKGSVNLNFEN